jgi:hypothetical protein
LKVSIVLILLYHENLLLQFLHKCKLVDDSLLFVLYWFKVKSNFVLLKEALVLIFEVLFEGLGFLRFSMKVLFQLSESLFDAVDFGASEGETVFALVGIFLSKFKFFVDGLD